MKVTVDIDKVYDELERNVNSLHYATRATIDDAFQAVCAQLDFAFSIGVLSYGNHDYLFECAKRIEDGFFRD